MSVAFYNCNDVGGYAIQEIIEIIRNFLFTLLMLLEYYVCDNCFFKISAITFFLPSHYFNKLPRYAFSAISSQVNLLMFFSCLYCFTLKLRVDNSQIIKAYHYKEG